MSEKLSRNQGGEKLEAELPAEKFRVDKDDYPLFSLQGQMDARVGNNNGHRLNIDQTLSRYVTSTADTIITIDGTSTKYEMKEGLEKPDHVIYLDKSARPVSWLVNAFWDKFSEAKRPETSFLNIDRLPWLQRAGMEVDYQGQMKYPDGSLGYPTIQDFKAEADKIPDETFAKIRALYVDGGIETEDPEEIMKMPTKLDGKNLLIIDEVQNTGLTAQIAEYVMQRAIPELKSVQHHYFWPVEVKVNNGQAQHLGTPVWYDHNTVAGRGIGEINQTYFDERHEQFATPKTRAQKMGALVLSQFVDLGKEERHLSRELASEILQMRKDYDDGKIFLRTVENMDLDKMEELMEAQGVRYAMASDKSPDTYRQVVEAIDSRKA